jgi:magnesium transporter
MIACYGNTEAGLAPAPVFADGCWVHATDPSAQELTDLQRRLCIPQAFLAHSLDQGELPRTAREAGAMLIVLSIPHGQGVKADVPYATVPLGIILTDKFIVTVCKYDTEIISELLHSHLGSISTTRHNRFLLQLLQITAECFLRDLHAINQIVDRLEVQLGHSLRNRELLELLRYQKSLVYFTTALKSNELMLQHLQKSHLFQEFPDDQVLLDDVLTEVQQAIEMTGISSNILSQMMDAFASIISNNLNVVMKFMAAVTIIVSLPTLIASLYGMNVRLPFQSMSWAFPAILALSLALALAVSLVFWRKDWL